MEGVEFLDKRIRQHNRKRNYIMQEYKALEAETFDDLKKVVENKNPESTWSDGFSTGLCTH